MKVLALALAFVSLALVGLDAWLILRYPPGLAVTWIGGSMSVGSAVYFMVQACRRDA